jgi:hypothetical protein
LTPLARASSSRPSVLCSRGADGSFRESSRRRNQVLPIIASAARLFNLPGATSSTCCCDPNGTFTQSDLCRLCRARQNDWGAVYSESCCGDAVRPTCCGAAPVYDCLFVRTSRAGRSTVDRLRLLGRIDLNIRCQSHAVVHVRHTKQRFRANRLTSPPHAASSPSIAQSGRPKTVQAATEVSWI